MGYLLKFTGSGSGGAGTLLARMRNLKAELWQRHRKGPWVADMGTVPGPEESPNKCRPLYWEVHMTGPIDWTVQPSGVPLAV